MFSRFANDSSGLKIPKKFVVVLCYCVHGQNFSQLVWAFTPLHKNTWHVCRLQPKSVAWIGVPSKVHGIVLGHCKSSWHSCGSLHKFVAWLGVPAKVCGIVVTHLSSYQRIGKRMFSPLCNDSSGLKIRNKFVVVQCYCVHG